MNLEQIKFKDWYTYRPIDRLFDGCPLIQMEKIYLNTDFRNFFHIWQSYVINASDFTWIRSIPVNTIGNELTGRREL